jgi:hypothetical protein
MRPKGDISYVSDYLWPSQEAIDKGDVDQKEGKDVNILNANMPFRKPISNEDIGKVPKNLELKHELWKLNKVQLKQLEEKKRHLQEGICKLEYIIFDQIFESLKVCFLMYYLHAKNCKVINL